ncbi:endonuclease domain-containing protein [Clostridium sp. Mt-5]|uniref:Endonuclease domain-containing protein n=1 Tax=Clostridium moutaii TaxID=3240932 RepID=A0ABV4BS40_9CLOT
MGYQEAIKDNISMFKDRYGDNIYRARCYICGKPVNTRVYHSNTNYRCKECKEKEANKTRLISTELKRKKLENAIKRIKRQKNNIKQYGHAIEKIKELLPTPNWFQSTEEIMVGIELYKRKIKFNHQVKINKYIVDFVLPEQKIVLEVDGELFHNELTIEKEKIRDSIILLNLGPEWEVIRIKDKYINKNINKLTTAITKVNNMRKHYRLSHNGQLPKGFNEHCV